MGIKQAIQNFMFEVMVLPYPNSLKNQQLIGYIKKEAGIYPTYIH